MLNGRIGQGAAKRGSENGTDRPHQRHDTERARLQLALRNHLCNHGPDRADIAVHEAQQGTGDQKRSERLGEAEHQRKDHGKAQAQQDGRLASESIRERAPGNGHDTLTRGGNGRRNAHPPGYIILGHSDALDHLRLCIPVSLRLLLLVSGYSLIAYHVRQYRSEHD